MTATKAGLTEARNLAAFGLLKALESDNPVKAASRVSAHIRKRMKKRRPARAYRLDFKNCTAKAVR